MGNEMSTRGPEVLSGDLSESAIKSAQSSALNSLDNDLRIAVAIVNKTNFTFDCVGRQWGGGRCAFLDGGPSGSRISPRQAVVFGGEKKFGLYGVAYLVTYQFEINGEPYTLDVAFKVAFRGDNWWNVAITKGHSYASQYRYDELRVSSFIATGQPAVILLDNRRFSVTGKQGIGDHSRLTIIIEYNDERKSKTC